MISDAAHGFGAASANCVGADMSTYGKVYVGTNGRGIFYGAPSGTLPAATATASQTTSISTTISSSSTSSIQVTSSKASTSQSTTLTTSRVSTTTSKSTSVTVTTSSYWFPSESKKLLLTRYRTASSGTAANYGQCAIQRSFFSDR